jgi:hypothetical protein
MSARLLLASLLALAALPAVAQEVLRCAGADGKASYVSDACPAGTSLVRTLPLVEAPSEAEQKMAIQRAQRDVRSAAALDRQRQAAEQRAAREQQLALAAAARQQTLCRRLLAGLGHAQEDLARARSRNRIEAQRRLARAEDQYLEDCGPLRR